MKESEIRDKISEGWVRGIFTFEVAGKPKEHVEESLQEYITNIKKDERIRFLHEEHEEIIEHDDGIFSTFAECELLVKDLETVTWLCINFTPASIEIVDPDEYRIEAREFTNWFNDLLAKLHKISDDYRETKGGNRHMVVAMNQLIMNSVLLALKLGENTEKELQQKTGVHHEQLKPFLDHLIEKGQIIEVDGKYKLPA